MSTETTVTARSTAGESAGRNTPTSTRKVLHPPEARRYPYWPCTALQPFAVNQVREVSRNSK